MAIGVKADVACRRCHALPPGGLETVFAPSEKLFLQSHQNPLNRSGASTVKPRPLLRPPNNRPQIFLNRPGANAA